jgi:hypothetical protein
LFLIIFQKIFLNISRTYCIISQNVVEW